MIDFHAHIDLYPDPQAIARECHLRKIHVLSVTTTPSAWKVTASLAVPGSRVRTALGFHPQIAHERRGEMDLFDAYLRDTRYVGEIGLDGAPQFKPYWASQVEIFDHILMACGEAGGKIMSIHSRRAASAVMDRLALYPDSGVPILHWFSGDRRELDRAISLNCWFTVGPGMLLSARSRDMISHMPRRRVLTETDGPFTQIAGRTAMPWDAGQVASQLASLWGVTDQDADRTLCANLQDLLGSPQLS